MTSFFDTSVLVAAFLRDHRDHRPSMLRLAAASRESACCAAHSLAEVYSVLTRLPVKPAIAPAPAMLFIGDVVSRLTTASLDAEGYARALQAAARDGITGGRVYDALLLECARAVGATEILTWNVRDFTRIAPDLAGRIRTP